MADYKKGNITRKLLLSFCLLIVIFLIFGLYTLYDIRTISGLTRTIYNHPLVVSNAALQSNISITKMHRNMKDVVLFENQHRIQLSIKKVNFQEQQVYKHLDIVRNRILGDEGRQLESKARVLFSNWKAIRDEVIHLVSSGQRKKAAEITIGKGADHVSRLEEEMLGLTNYARAKATSFMAESEKTNTRLNITSIIFLVAAITISFTVAIFTLRSTLAAENELRESRQLLSTAIDNAPIGMILVEPEGRFYKVNQAYCEITGYSEKELLGMNFQDITHSDDYDIGPETIKKLLNGDANKAQLEKRYLRKSGEIIHVLLTTSLLKDIDEKPLYFFTQVQDVTERKKAEQQLKENSQALAERVKELNCLYGIAKLLKQPEMPLDELLQGAVNIIAPSWQYPDITCSRILLDGREYRTENFKKTIWKQETSIVAKDKRLGVLEVYYLNEAPEKDEGPFLKEERNLINTIGNQIGRIIEHKQMDQELRQAYKMEAIGTLAGGIAHDFNNVLASIIGFTELALDEVKRDTTLDDSLQEVYKAAIRARDLVKQILAFARQSEEQQKPIQLGLIAKEVLKFIRSTIPTTIEIKQFLDSDSLIMGNTTQVYQVLMNLCTNAAYAMEKHGGILEVSLKDVTAGRIIGISSANLKHDDYVELKVSDTGEGIAPDILSSIFEPYFTTKGPGEGTGMGLAMVQGIVETYGGHISVDSKIGKGSRFTLYFPITRKRKAQRAYVQEALPRGTEKILFIDDEAPIAKIGSQILERLGYTVTTRTSSIEALELLRSKPNSFDLVVSDMTMPNITGDQLAIEMLKIRPDIPIILCTGYSNKLSEETALEIGIKALTYKPIVKADLAKTVRMVLDENSF